MSEIGLSDGDFNGMAVHVPYDHGLKKGEVFRILHPYPSITKDRYQMLSNGYARWEKGLNSHPVTEEFDISLVAERIDT